MLNLLKNPIVRAGISSVKDCLAVYASSDMRKSCYINSFNRAINCELHEVLGTSPAAVEKDAKVRIDFFPIEKVIDIANNSFSLDKPKLSIGLFFGKSTLIELKQSLISYDISHNKTVRSKIASLPSPAELIEIMKLAGHKSPSAYVSEIKLKGASYQQLYKHLKDAYLFEKIIDYDSISATDMEELDRDHRNSKESKVELPELTINIITFYSIGT